MGNVRRILKTDDKGQNLVEFALVVSLLLAILFGIAEFGRAWFYSNHLTNSVRAAARYGAVLTPFDSNQVKQYLIREIDNEGAGPLHAADINDAGTTVQVFSSYSSATPVSDANITKGDTIKVRVTYNFRVLVGSYLLPFFPFNESNPIVRTAEMQYEEGSE
jgi:Flp pilus assembly protein TadG